MLSRKPIWGLLATALMVVATPHASASLLFTGNPNADNWTPAGADSALPPNYVGPAPSVPGGVATEFALYKNTTTTTLQFLTNCGLPCQAWQVGDMIVGLAGLVTGPNNAASVFLKWGVTASAYSSSTSGAPTGNGLRDFLNGEGGLGSVMATFALPRTDGVASFPTLAQQWTGFSAETLSIAPATNYIAFNSISTSSVFTSFEGYLNVTRLNAANSMLYVYNGNSIVGVRSFGDPFTETNALVAGVPEPATGLLAGGALLAAWLVRRRR